MNNFQVNKLEVAQLNSVVGGTDIIEEDSDFNIIGEEGEMLHSIIEDDGEF